MIVHAELHNQKRERNFEELYKFNLTRHNAANMLCAWWLARRVYTMGPSVDLLLSHQNSDCRGQPFYKLLGNIKGVSNPYACDPVSLRGSLRACNRSLNLVHVSDSPMASVREFSIFRNGDELIRGIRRATENKSIPEKINSIRTQIEDSLQWWIMGSKVSLSSSIATISARLLTSCKWDSKNIPTVARLMGLYGEINTIDDQPNPSAGLDILRRKLYDVGKYIQLLAAENQDVTDKLMSLCDTENYNHQIAEKVIATTINRGVDIDPWDMLAMETSMFHARDFSAPTP